MYNDIDFNADVRPIFDANGNAISSDIGRGVYRDDTDELIGLCGNQYQPVQHRDIVDPVLQSLEKDGYKLEDRNAGTRSDFYDLKGRKGAFISTKTEDNGAVMRTDIILGDFIQPTGSAAYLPKGDDTMFYRITLLNSHSGKLAIRANTSFLRLVCLNSMVDAKWQASTRAKHTSGLNIDALKARILNGMSAMGKDGDRFGLYARTKVSIGHAETFFKQTICKLANKPNGDAHFSQPLVNKLLTNFQREDQTVFGLWNAMTAWATHDTMRANASILSGRLGRDDQVATTMRSPEFSALLAA